MDGWSKPAATSALVQDEAIQTFLGMNQKHILFPYPEIFQPLFLPQNFPLLPPSPHFPLTPSQKFLSLNNIELQGDVRHKA
jgi:hypothetical protein